MPGTAKETLLDRVTDIARRAAERAALAHQGLEDELKFQEPICYLQCQSYLA